MRISVVKIELKDDGETLIVYTMLWEGLPRKTVINIRDIEPHR